MDIKSYKLAKKYADMIQINSYANPVLVKNTTLAPVISFIDDDSHDKVWTVLKPLYDSKDIKSGIAVISGRINNVSFPGYLTIPQLQQLQSEGWEILGHSVNHASALDTQTLTDAESELSGCLTQLTTMGLNVDNFVYPFNSSNYEVQKILKKYYKLGIGEIEAYPTNSTPIMTGELTRRNLGTWFDAGIDPTATDGATADTFNYYKWLVDYAVSTKSWLIFVTHCNEITSDQLIILGQVIDYIKSINVPILLPRDAYKIFSNRYEDGTISDPTTDPYGQTDFNAVDRNGYRYSGRELINYKGDPALLTITSPITDYKVGMTSITLTSITGTAFPEGTAGVLITTRTKTDDQDYQLWHPAYTNNIYKRRWNSGAWTPFTVIGASGGMTSLPGVQVSLNFGTIAAGATVTQTVTVTGCVAGQMVTVDPKTAPANGLIWNALIVTSNTVTIRMTNVTAAQIVDVARNWKVYVVNVT